MNSLNSFIHNHPKASLSIIQDRSEIQSIQKGEGITKYPALLNLPQVTLSFPCSNLIIFIAAS